VKLLSYKEKAIKGVSWHLLSYIISAPIAYLVRILYANEIPKLDVGLFYAIWDFVNILVVFRAFGLDQALIRYIPKYLAENRLDMLKSSIVFVGIFQTILTFIVALLVVVFSPYIAELYINNQGQFTGRLDLVVNVLIIMVGGYYLLDSIVSFFSCILMGFQLQNYASSTRVVRILSVFAFSLALIYIFNIHNAYVPSVSYTLMAIVMIVIYGYIVFKKIFQKYVKEKLTFSKKFIVDLFSYGVYVMMGYAGSLILGYLDGICLTYFTGLNAVADYRNVAMPTVSILSYFAFSIGTVLFPMSSELWEKGYKKALSYGIEKVFLYSLITIVPLTILMAYFPTIIINVLFNPQYLSAAPALQILSLGALFSTFNAIGFNIINGIGKPNISTKILYIGAIFNLVFNILLIPKFGIIGAAITTVFGYFIMWILQIWFLSRFLEHQFLNKKWILVILIGIFSLIPVVFIKDLVNNPILKLFICGIVYFGIYMLGIIWFKIIDIYEVKDIISNIIKR